MGSLPSALRLLARFWLEEIRPADLPTITALPELAETLPAAGPGNPAHLGDLAVEYQRLFGFNLPPYESIFVDPSGMLMGPAAARVETLYRQAGWLPPPARVGAPDHLGLELIALADWLEQGLAGPAGQMHAAHLALWVPAFLVTLRRLAPPPFYSVLGELTVDLLLVTLPDRQDHLPADPFPVLPADSIVTVQGLEPPPDGEPRDDPRRLVRLLLTPCQAGLYLTREDIARISQGLDLPVVMGDRLRLLETLFRQAGEYELVPALLARLHHLLDDVDAAYNAWAGDTPAWLPYANAWRSRLANGRALLTSLVDNHRRPGLNLLASL